jgi:thioester reductase-like protein
MNYLQEYEKLKKANALITPGSIWEDCCGEVKILYTTSINVYYTNLPSGGKEDYSLNNFKKHFHRVG